METKKKKKSNMPYGKKNSGRGRKPISFCIKDSVLARRMFAFDEIDSSDMREGGRREIRRYSF